MPSFLGIDENGLGPVMGPLVVTGVCANRDVPEDRPFFIKDSKKLFTGPQKLKRLEATALAIFHALSGNFPKNTEDLFNKSCFLKCPKESPKICLENVPELFSWSTPEDGRGKAAALAAFLKSNNIQITGIKSVAVCPLEFNRLCAKNLKKDFIDYLQFEKLIKHFLKPDQELNVSAGKIGGRDRYMAFLSRTFVDWEAETGTESPAVSSYVFGGQERRVEVNFIRDVEEHSFLAALSGIFGKYVRELIMESVNRSLSAVPRVSGYRDKTTKQFLKTFLASPRASSCDPDCLVRRK